MNERKNLLIVLGEWWETRQTASHTSKVESADSPGRLRRVLSWFVPNGGTLLLIAVLLFTQNVWARSTAAPVAPGPSATTVNYQGRLADPSGTPLDGTYGMSFSLWDAATDGNLVWGPENHTAVPVSDGLFSVGLGSQTSGGIPITTWDGDRYLEIAVGGETLAPRELIRSVPIAGMALTVPDGAIGTGQIADGGVESSDLNLNHGTVCLSSHAVVDLPGGQSVPVPGLTLDFSLDSPAQVLIWMDGLAKFEQSSNGQADLFLYVDDHYETGSFTFDTEDIWFNVKGQRILNLDSGSHTIDVRASSAKSGQMAIKGGTGVYRTCINYLVLGEQ